MNNQLPWPDGLPFATCPNGHALTAYSKKIEDRLYGECSECTAPFIFGIISHTVQHPLSNEYITLERVPIPPSVNHLLPMSFEPFGVDVVYPEGDTLWPPPVHDQLVEAYKQGLLSPSNKTGVKIVQQMSEATIKNLLSDGVEMGNALRILKRRLHAVGAGLLEHKGEWLVLKALPAYKNDKNESFPTFSQAFDAALTLLIERSGSVNSTVTPSGDVFKMMGGEDKQE